MGSSELHILIQEEAARGMWGAYLNGLILAACRWKTVPGENKGLPGHFPPASLMGCEGSRGKT